MPMAAARVPVSWDAGFAWPMDSCSLTCLVLSGLARCSDGREYTPQLDILPISRYCRAFPPCYTLWPIPTPGEMLRWGKVGRKKSARRQGFWGWFCAILGGGFIAERSFRQADRIRVNDRIRAREIRVVDEAGGTWG